MMIDAKPIKDLMADYMRRHWPALTWTYDEHGNRLAVLADEKEIAEAQVDRHGWGRLHVDLLLDLDRQITAAWAPSPPPPLAEFMRRYERIDSFLRKGEEHANISVPKAPTNEIIEMTVESAAKVAISLVEERASKTYFIDGYVRADNRKFESGRSPEIQKANNSFAYLCAIGNAIAIKLDRPTEEKAAA